MRIFLITTLILTPFFLSGQQLPSWSSYYETGFVWNPALTAKWNSTELSLTHRQDWIGFDDAPQYSNLSFQYPFVKGIFLETKSAVGGFLERDAVGPIEKIGGALTYNYRFRPQLLGNRRDVLGIGLAVSFSKFQVDLSKATAYDPNSLTIDIDEISDIFRPNSNVGLFYISVSDKEAYTRSHYYIGFSVNNLISNDIAEFNRRGDAIGLTTIQSGLHSTLHLGYRSLPQRAGYFLEPNLMFIFSLQKGVHAIGSFRFEMIDHYWAAAGISTVGEAFVQVGYIFDRRSALKNLVQDGMLRIGLKGSYQMGTFRTIAGPGIEFYTSYVFELR